MAVVLLVSLFLSTLATASDLERHKEQNSEEPNCAKLDSCTCTSSELTIRVHCFSVTDFVMVSRTLWEMFGSNGTEVILTRTSSLPPKAFKDLNVTRLLISGSLSEVSEEVFRDMLWMTELRVSSSRIESIPDLHPVRYSVSVVSVDNSLLTEVRGNFQDLPLLIFLSLRNNSISVIAEDAFKGSEAISTLDLSCNKLVSLPKFLLDGLRHLKNVDLSNNQLITVGGLLDYINPTSVLLSHNNLTDVEDLFHSRKGSIEVLRLDHNPLRRITTQTFGTKTPNIRHLFLNRTNLTEFDVGYFRSMEKLEILNLSGNRIASVPEQDIEIGRDLEIVFNDNVIETFRGNVLFTIKKVFIAGNRLTLLHNVFKNSQPTSIDVSRNRLVAIEANNFLSAHGTRNISFSCNDIQRIDRKSFVAIRNDLESLSLSMNRLQSLNGSVQYQSKLKSLDISYNQISLFSDVEFVGVNELSELYAQNNRIITMTGQLETLPRLQLINIQNNWIKTMDLNHVPKSLKYIGVKDNPIECDCRLLPFLEWLHSPASPETDISLCESLEESPSLSCPDPCFCSCSHDANGSYVTMDCSSRHLMTIPPFSKSISYDQLLLRISSSQFSISDQVLAMNFENNNISTLEDIPFPPNLKQLYLADNLLTNLPQSVMNLKWLHRMTLANNPWTCDCSTVETRKWLLSKIEGIHDVNITKCHSHQGRSLLNDRVIIALSDVDLCPSEVGLYIAIAFGLLTFLLLCAAFKITYTRYEMNIKVWLYAHGATWVKEKDNEDDKPFDAFVSFSHKDEAFVVNELVAEIEKRSSSVRLCLHYRHFQPGEFIHDNIINAVKYSKRTVLILSRNFLESEWCLMEFRTAHLQALEDRVHKIIVIKMPNLPEEVDPAIKVYLDSTTYVSWGEKHFWQKLMYALPTSADAKETVVETKETMM